LIAELGIAECGLPEFADWVSVHPSVPIYTPQSPIQRSTILNPESATSDQQSAIINPQ